MTLRITGGVHRGRRLRVLERAGLRPTSDRVRLALFSVLGSETLQGSRVVDLFAGTGVLGLETLSRGAAWCDFVDVDARRCRQIRETLTELALDDRAHVYEGRVEAILPTLKGGYDLALVDPPYETADWDGFMSPLGRADTMKDGGLVVVEHRHTTAAGKRFGRLSLDESRRYGDTAISIYEARAVIG